MDVQNFVFSLYPGDLVRIKKAGGVKLSLAENGTGEKEIIRKDGLYYYRGTGISTGSLKIETHDRRYLQSSLGVKTLESIEKYQVDVIGNYWPVRIPEKRMDFSKED